MFRRFGPPPFARGNWEQWQQRGWDGPRGWGGPRGWEGPRGPQGPEGPWGHGFRGHHYPSPEQQAMRSTAAEVARLFMIAGRSSQDNPQKQAQLRDFLERSRKELTDIIYSGNQQSGTNQGGTTDNAPGVEQA